MKTSLADLDQSDRLGLPPRAEEPEPPSLEARLAEAEGVLRGIAAEPCHCGGCGPALQCPPCMARAYFAAQGGAKPHPERDAAPEAPAVEAAVRGAVRDGEKALRRFDAAQREAVSVRRVRALDCVHVLRQLVSVMRADGPRVIQVTVTSKSGGTVTVGDAATDPLGGKGRNAEDIRRDQDTEWRCRV